MIEMNLAEAQLFRMLVGFFGRERVVWSMSLRAVCGGALPSAVKKDVAIRDWAERDKCLFTIVDNDDNPKLVFEFSPDLSSYIEVEQIERQKRLPPILDACGVQYVTISSSEFGEITNPDSSLDFISFLKGKFGIEDSSEEAVDE